MRMKRQIIKNIYLRLKLFIPIVYFRYSKQLYLGDTGKPIIMNDGTDGFQDFSGNKNNRFGSHSAAMKNRIQPPSRVCMNSVR